MICCDFTFMQQLPVPLQQPVRFRPTLAYRPLISLTPTSSYILAGGGQAVFIQHSILTCLFEPTGASSDIRALGHCALALQLIAQSWTQVDTPSVCAVGFTSVASHSMDVGTVILTGVTELDSLTDANTSEFLKGGLEAVEPSQSTPLEGDVSADPIEQFSSVPNAQDPIEQFSFGPGVTTDSTFSASDQLSKDVVCIDGNDYKSLFGDSVTLHQQESGALDRLLEDDGFMSNSAEVASVPESALDLPASSDGLDHSSIQTALAQSLETHVPKFMWEQDSFLNLVFGKDDVVDNLFPHVDMKRPHGALTDLTGVNDYDPPISKALRRGAGRPLYLRVFKQSTIACA